MDIFPIEDKLKDEEGKSEMSSTFVEIGRSLRREVSTLMSRFPHWYRSLLQDCPTAIVQRIQRSHIQVHYNGTGTSW